MKRKLFPSPRQTNFVHLNCCRSLLLLLLLSFPPHYCVNRETIKLTRKFKSMTDILWLLLSSERVGKNHKINEKESPQIRYDRKVEKVQGSLRLLILFSEQLWGKVKFMLMRNFCCLNWWWREGVLSILGFFFIEQAHTNNRRTPRWWKGILIYLNALRSQIVFIVIVIFHEITKQTRKTTNKLQFPLYHPPLNEPTKKKKIH